jgi:general stress protein 26
MQDNKDRFWTLVTKLDICMLATRSGDKIRSRPMSAIARPEDNDIVMLTDKWFVKDQEIEQSNNVNLSYSNGSGTFVSVEGAANIVDDRTLINDCWSSGAQLYWPDGPDDPNIVAIVVTPCDVEYWESDNKFIAGMKFAYGLATHSTPSLGDNKKLRL